MLTRPHTYRHKVISENNFPAKLQWLPAPQRRWACPRPLLSLGCNAACAYFRCAPILCSREEVETTRQLLLLLLYWVALLFCWLLQVPHIHTNIAFLLSSGLFGTSCPVRAYPTLYARDYFSALARCDRVETSKLIYSHFSLDFAFARVLTNAVLQYFEESFRISFGIMRKI